MSVGPNCTFCGHQKTLSKTLSNSSSVDLWLILIPKSCLQTVLKTNNNQQGQGKGLFVIAFSVVRTIRFGQQTADA